jgi:hypothetical protein
VLLTCMFVTANEWSWRESNAQLLGPAVLAVAAGHHAGAVFRCTIPWAYADRATTAQQARRVVSVREFDRGTRWCWDPDRSRFGDRKRSQATEI